MTGIEDEAEYNLGDWVIRWTGYFQHNGGTSLAGYWFAYDYRNGRRPRESITAVTGSEDIQIVKEGAEFEVKNQFPIETMPEILKLEKAATLYRLLDWINRNAGFGEY
jgi:hypothetical protein